MDACRQVIDHIKSTFDTPEEIYIKIFNLSEVLLSAEKDIPPLEVFMSPEPDVKEPGKSYLRNPTTSNRKSLLGSYCWIQSTGNITLYKQNLTNFFWRLVFEIEKKLPGIRWCKNDLFNLVEWVVFKTFTHERFHHSMEVMRYLLDVQTFDPWQEEALAVAYSRHSILEIFDVFNREHCHDKSPLRVISDEFMGLAYQYNSRGYREWVKYADHPALKAGICDYLAPHHNSELKAARIPVVDMLFQLLPVENGFVEHVV